MDWYYVGAATLADLAGLLRDQQARKADIVAPAAAIRARAGRLVVDDSVPVLGADGVTMTAGAYVPTEVCDQGIADKLVMKLRARMEKLRVGSPLDKAVDMGASVAPVQLERIRSLVEQGAKEGAELWHPSWAVPKDGCFYPPPLFTTVAPSSFMRYTFAAWRRTSSEPM